MEDKRDMRDPEDLGNIIMMLRKEHPDLTASERADLIVAGVRPYKPPLTLQEQETLKYQAELRARAEAGDVHAHDLLDEQPRPVHTPSSRSFFERAQERYPLTGHRRMVPDVEDPDPADADHYLDIEVGGNGDGQT